MESGANPSVVDGPLKNGSSAGRGPDENAALAGLFMSGVAVRDLSDGGLEQRLRLLARAKSRVAALDAEAVAELARRRGEAGAVEMLREGLGQSRSGAKRDVKFAGVLAAMPVTAAALAEGAITPQHARLIVDAAEHVPVDEAELVAAARREHVDLFRRTVREHVNDRLGDDLEERRRHQRAQRGVSLKQQPDGMYTLFGRFDPVAGNRIETALTAAASRLWHAEDPKNRATGGQRLADALEMLICRRGDGKAQGVDLLVVAEYDVVAGELQNPRLADGTPLTPEELLRLACDANILPALFDVEGQPLWLGQGRRHATSGQRAVLTKRDRGCVGCGANANWCQAHHIVHWAEGGPTDIDNMCLLCSHCHHQVHTKGARIVRTSGGKYTLQHPQRPRPRPPPRSGCRPSSPECRDGDPADKLSGVG